jgi:hypothetical protein
MNIIIKIFLPLVILYLITTYIYKLGQYISFVKSNIDGHMYLVRDLSDKQAAADRLAEIKQQMSLFIDKLSQKFPDKPEVQRLKEKYKPSNISEGTGTHGYTTYTVNKGEEMVFC